MSFRFFRACGPSVNVSESDGSAERPARAASETSPREKIVPRKSQPTAVTAARTNARPTSGLTSLCMRLEEASRPDHRFGAELALREGEGNTFPVPGRDRTLRRERKETTIGRTTVRAVALL